MIKLKNQIKTMKMLKRTTITLVLIMIGFINMFGQSLTLEECYELAEINYPVVKQYELIEKSREFNLSNVSKGYLPQFTVSGQLSYQSDVTKIPFSMPDMEIPILSKDQYRIHGEIVQPLSDMFTTLRYKRNIVESETDFERKKTDVELYQLKERINQLYFGVLLVEAQIIQIGIMKTDIKAALNKVYIAIENGVALKSSADLLNAELLKAEQKTIEAESMKKSLSAMLSIFIDRDIDESTILEKPAESIMISGIKRPELQMFESQKNNIEAKSKLLDAGIRPRLNLFAQGGYGKPALNMLANEFDYYFIGGVRLTWNLSNLYTHKKEKQILKITQNSIDIQKDAFLFNLGLNVTQQNSEIEKLQEIIEKDKEIIKLRENIRKSAESQLEHGTVTTNDYLVYINAEDQAKQDLIYHEIQKLSERYSLKTTVGN